MDAGCSIVYNGVYNGVILLNMNYLGPFSYIVKYGKIFKVGFVCLAVRTFWHQTYVKRR